MLYFFASKISVELPPEKKVPWQWRGAARCRWSNCHFFQKNAFFGQKKAFFQKVHFIQKCSATQNTGFQCVKNNFLLYQKKLIFFTILNLLMALDVIFKQYFPPFLPSQQFSPPQQSLKVLRNMPKLGGMRKCILIKF